MVIKQIKERVYMDKLDKLQNEVLAIKNKKGNKKMKAPKTYTLKQIIKTVIIALALLSAGAFTGITIEKAITNTINSQVKEQTAEQVKVFTEAVEVKE